MGDIGAGLVERRDRVPPRHVAVPQTGDLGKDEPDPMAGLAPAPELVERAGVRVLLRQHESIQIVWHGAIVVECRVADSTLATRRSNDQRSDLR